MFVVLGLCVLIVVCIAILIDHLDNLGLNKLL